MTIVKRKYRRVDCAATPDPFPNKVVISCISFVSPAVTTWMLHIAISNSIVHLTLKSFEGFVWGVSVSICFRRFIAFCIFASWIVFIGLLGSGLLTEFVTSWLAFVISLSVPIWLHTVWRTSKLLQQLQKSEVNRVQVSIEEKLKVALADLESKAITQAQAQAQAPAPAPEEANPEAQSTASFRLSPRALMTFPGFLMVRSSVSAGGSLLSRAMPRSNVTSPTGMLATGSSEISSAAGVGDA